MPRKRTPQLLFCVLLLAVSLLSVPVWANGSTVRMYLSWLPRVCNCGSEQVQGEAEVNVGEGYVSLAVQNLPPVDGGAYEVWLVTADRTRWISLGRFFPDEAGYGEYSALVDDVPVLDYRYLLITQEPDPDTEADHSGCIVLGGVFPDREVVLVPMASATPETRHAGGWSSPNGQTAEAGTLQTEPPTYLPETGAAASSWNPLLFATAIIAILKLATCKSVLGGTR